MSKLQVPNKNKNKKKKKSKGKSKDTKSHEKEFSKRKPDKKERQKRKVDPLSLIPSGSTMFNLECSDNIAGAFQLGKYENLIGDSSSGKTLFAWTMFAACSKDKRFDKYKLIMADCEAAGEFDIKYLFGKKTFKRVIDNPDDAPDTVEEFADQIGDLIEAGEPFIYVLDSVDSISSEAEQKLEAENRKKRKKGQKTDGSYGMEKQKYLSKFFRTTKKKLRKMKSTIILISQTRDNIGFAGFLNPKSRSGGKALKFYSTHECWGSIGKSKKEGKRRTITATAWKITKNKITGRHGIAYFDIVQDYGIDDIGSMINFLADEGTWSCASDASPTPPTSKINCKGWQGIKEKMGFRKLIDKIEAEGLQSKLKEEAQVQYNDVLAALDHGRVMRYD